MGGVDPAPVQMWDAVPNGSAENDRPMSAGASKACVPVAATGLRCSFRRQISAVEYKDRNDACSKRNSMHGHSDGEAIVQGSHRSQRNSLSCRRSGIRHIKDLGEAISQNSSRMQWREGESVTVVLQHACSVHAIPHKVLRWPLEGEICKLIRFLSAPPSWPN